MFVSIIIILKARQIFFYTLFSEPSDIQKWWFGIKIKFYLKNGFYLFSDLRPKKISIFMKKNVFS
jgi:hypothetical protein